MIDIACPECGESEELRGERSGDGIEMLCGACRHRWRRSLQATCPTCGRTDLRRVPLAIVEKGRGTQLSVVGTRPIYLCPDDDGDVLARWQANRPNPLMPDELPTS